MYNVLHCDNKKYDVLHWIERLLDTEICILSINNILHRPWLGGFKYRDIVDTGKIWMVRCLEIRYCP